MRDLRSHGAVWLLVAAVTFTAGCAMQASLPYAALLLLVAAYLSGCRSGPGPHGESGEWQRCCVSGSWVPYPTRNGGTECFCPEGYVCNYVQSCWNSDAFLFEEPLDASVEETGFADAELLDGTSLDMGLEETGIDDAWPTDDANFDAETGLAEAEPVEDGGDANTADATATGP